MEKSMIVFENVHKKYTLGKNTITALNGVNFKIHEGDFVSIIGPSGSGKTTILNLIGCIDEPSLGDVFIHGVNSRELSDQKASAFRNNTIGFIFQSFNLLPVLNIYENIEYPLLIQKNKVSKQEKDKIHRLIEEVGLGAHIKHRPDELSGGQMQRVAIARALINNPKIVIADEPTANLDHKTGTLILELMKKLNEEYKTTFIFSTHDQLVMSYAKRKIKILDGEIEEERK